MAQESGIGDLSVTHAHCLAIQLYLLQHWPGISAEPEEIKSMYLQSSAHTFSRCRTTTGSDTTMKALGPKASLYTPPLSRNLQPRHN